MDSSRNRAGKAKRTHLKSNGEQEYVTLCFSPQGPAHATRWFHRGYPAYSSRHPRRVAFAVSLPEKDLHVGSSVPSHDTRCVSLPGNRASLHTTSSMGNEEAETNMKASRWAAETNGENAENREFVLLCSGFLGKPQLQGRSAIRDGVVLPAGGPGRNTL